MSAKAIISKHTDKGLTKVFSKIFSNDIDPNLAKSRVITIKPFLKKCILSFGLLERDIFINQISENGENELGKITKIKEDLQKIYDNKDGGDDKTYYNQLKNSTPMKELFKVAQKLAIHKENITNTDLTLENLNFITRIAGINVNLLPFTTINFKNIWAQSSCTRKIKQYIIKILGHLLTNIVEIYKITTLPNIDVEQMGDIIINKVEELRGTVDRCDLAFDKISDSAKLFKKNFVSYYRDSIKAKNPNLIIQNFLSDVSYQEKKINHKVVFQIRKIMKTIQAKIKTSSIKKSPEVNQMFKIMEEKLDLLNSVTSKKKYDE